MSDRRPTMKVESFFEIINRFQYLDSLMSMVI